MVYNNGFLCFLYFLRKLFGAQKKKSFQKKSTVTEKNIEK